MTKFWFFAVMAVAVAFEVVADVLFKKWSINGKWLVFGIGLALYTVGTIFWAYSLRHEQLSKAITVFTVANLLAVTLLGVLVFKEKMTGVQLFGLILGLASIACLEWTTE